jgi:hypothetical protein
MAAEDSDASRPRREPKMTAKALEEKRRKNEARSWGDSDEEYVDRAIEAQLDILNAPRKILPRTTKANTKATGLTKDDLLSKILTAVIELKSDNDELKASTRDLIEELTEVKIQLEETRDQLAETNEQLTVTKTQLVKTESQLAKITLAIENTPSVDGALSGSPLQSYASVLARSTEPLVSVKLAPITDNLYCTIDTSRAEGDLEEAQPAMIRQTIEREMRTAESNGKWRCLAVNKDPRNASHIRIACRNETELQQVKDAAQKATVPGTRVLRDQLYPVKVDNANRTAVLDHHGNVLPGTEEMLGKENEVKIAKISWLSKKDSAKAYGSMVIYVTSRHDAARLLQGQYFHVAGESAYTKIFEPRERPLQCYKCQKLGHKAFSCTNSQICAKCAGEGHHHSGCQAAIPKCVLCGGPHESFSRNCRVLFPSRNE